MSDLASLTFSLTDMALCGVGMFMVGVIFTMFVVCPRDVGG